VQHVDPAIGWDDPAYTQPFEEPRPGRHIGRWLAMAYVGFTCVVAVSYFWAISVPGMRFLPWMASLYGVALIVVVWIVAAVVTLVRLLRGTNRRVGRYLLVVPLIGLVMLAARITEAPLRLRFEPARSEFTDFAQQTLAAAEGVVSADPESLAGGDPAWDALNPDVPLVLGGFPLRDARVFPEGLVIFDREGAFLDDAGLAYLPEGEFPAGDGSFESPSFRSLGGDWYAFTSSW